MTTLKPQSNGPPYSNTVIGTLAVDGWAVTFGTARRGLGGLRPPSTHCTKCNSHPSTAIVAISYYLMWHYNFLWILKELNRNFSAVLQCLLHPLTLTADVSPPKYNSVPRQLCLLPHSSSSAAAAFSSSVISWRNYIASDQKSRLMASREYNTVTVAATAATTTQTRRTVSWNYRVFRSDFSKFHTTLSTIFYFYLRG